MHLGSRTSGRGDAHRLFGCETLSRRASTCSADNETKRRRRSTLVFFFSCLPLSRGFIFFSPFGRARLPYFTGVILGWMDWMQRHTHTQKQTQTVRLSSSRGAPLPARLTANEALLRSVDPPSFVPTHHPRPSIHLQLSVASYPSWFFRACRSSPTPRSDHPWITSQLTCRISADPKLSPPRRQPICCPPLPAPPSIIRHPSSIVPTLDTDFCLLSCVPAFRRVRHRPCSSFAKADYSRHTRLDESPATLHPAFAPTCFSHQHLQSLIPRIVSCFTWFLDSHCGATFRLFLS